MLYISESHGVGSTPFSTFDTAEVAKVFTSGMVTTFSGHPYRPGDYETLASNGRIHMELRQVAADIQQRIDDEPKAPQKPAVPGRE